MVGALVEADEQNRRLLAAARVVVHVLSDPETPFTVSGICRATGLTADVVRQVISDPTIANTIAAHIKLTCSGYVARAVHELDRLTHNSKSDMVRVQAARALIAGYTAVAQATSLHAGTGAESNLKDMLRTMDEMRDGKVAKRLKCTVLGTEMLEPKENHASAG